MCDRKGCQRPGIWRIGFTFSALGHRGSTRASAESGITVCSEHREETTIENTFGHAQLMEALSGATRAMRLAAPDPDSLELTFVAVN